MDLKSAGGCRYLGMPGNPPKHWVECPPSGPGGGAGEARLCDTPVGGAVAAASWICLDNQSEPGASPNPAGDSLASLPGTAPRYIHYSR